MNSNIINDLINSYTNRSSNSFITLYNQNNTLVLKHLKYPDYLIKLSNKDFESSKKQKDILSLLPNNYNNFSRIYHTQVDNSDGNIRTLEIIDKINGTSKKEYTNLEIINTINSLKKLHTNLNNISNRNKFFFPSLKDLFNGIISNAHMSTKTIATEIQSYKEYSSFINSKQEYITIADLVYENILIDKEQINFIDLDPLILGPKKLQFSILLTSNILIQSNQFKILSINLIKKFFSLYGYNDFNREDLISLSIFPLLILSMRQVDLNTLPKDDSSMYYKLKVILLLIVKELANMND